MAKLSVGVLIATVALCAGVLEAKTQTEKHSNLRQRLKPSDARRASTWSEDPDEDKPESSSESEDEDYESGFLTWYDEEDTSTNQMERPVTDPETGLYYPDEEDTLYVFDAEVEGESEPFEYVPEVIVMDEPESSSESEDEDYESGFLTWYDEEDTSTNQMERPVTDPETGLYYPDEEDTLFYDTEVEGESEPFEFVPEVIVMDYFYDEGASGYGEINSYEDTSKSSDDADGREDDKSFDDLKLEHQPDHVDPHFDVSDNIKHDALLLGIPALEPNQPKHNFYASQFNGVADGP